MAGRPPLKTLTLNCNGLNNKIKSKRILSTLLKSQADIVFLQETHKTKSSDPLFETTRYPTQIQAYGTSKSRGVAILFSAKIRTSIESQEIDPNGRFLFLNVTIEGEPLSLASIYAPNEDQYKFLKETLTNLISFSTGPIILGGDLNFIIDPQQDYSGSGKRRGLRGESRGV